MMQLAAIDIGTNSLHMIVVRVRTDLSFEVVDREKEMVRLGAGGLDGRSLTREARIADKVRVISYFPGMKMSTSPSVVRARRSNSSAAKSQIA